MKILASSCCAKLKASLQRRSVPVGLLRRLDVEVRPAARNPLLVVRLAAAAGARPEESARERAARGETQAFRNCATRVRVRARGAVVVAADDRCRCNAKPAPAVAGHVPRRTVAAGLTRVAGVAGPAWLQVVVDAAVVAAPLRNPAARASELRTAARAGERVRVDWLRRRHELKALRHKAARRVVVDDALVWCRTLRRVGRVGNHAVDARRAVPRRVVHGRVTGWDRRG